MTNNGRNLIFAVLVLSVTAMAHHARAATILIEPDLFVAGSPLTTAFPGVRLSVEGKSHITVISIDGLIAVGPSAGNNLATTGSLVFGQTPAEGPDCCDTGQFWNEDEFGLLRADFETLANTVSIDFYFDDDDVGSLRGYDSLGNLLAFDFASERETSRTMSIHRPENDIASRMCLPGDHPVKGFSSTISRSPIIFHQSPSPPPYRCSCPASAYWASLGGVGRGQLIPSSIEGDSI